MKRFCILWAVVWSLGACASLPANYHTICSEQINRPSFFAQGETLAAFRMKSHTDQYGLEGILQIKKQGEEQYEIIVFSNVGAYRLLQGILTREGMKYTYLAPSIDRVVLRVKVERFLTLLLIPSLSQGKCKVKKDDGRVSDKHPIKKYQYPAGEAYPVLVTTPKPFGTVYLNFADYEPYEEGKMPHTLSYTDGKIEVSLTLLRLKK